MRFNNEMASFEALFNTITSFYQGSKGRVILIFDEGFPNDDILSGYFIRFLLDRKHVVEYRVANDRNMSLSVLTLAIGPQYFSPVDFWNYENSKKFSLEASTEAVVHNLRLLDEFLILSSRSSESDSAERC